MMFLLFQSHKVVFCRPPYAIRRFTHAHCTVAESGQASVWHSVPGLHVLNLAVV